MTGQHDTAMHDLEGRDVFIRRHIGPGPEDQAKMLKALGVDSLDALIGTVVPPAIRREGQMALDRPLTEAEVLDELRGLADRNRRMISLIGQGYHGTVTPPVIQRCVLENPAWYTAYTPYQPEISQGRLEALINFQTLVTDLTGLDIANASLLDEGTAAAEAMTLCHRQAKAKSDRFFVSRHCHPQTIAVVEARAEPLGIEIVVGDEATDLDAGSVFGALFQYPGTDGEVRDPRASIAALHEAGALAVVACDLLALTLLEAPGALGADVAVGSAQRFGVPMFFGGPHAAFFATRDAFKRSMPGRLVGVSVDADGRPAYRLALQAREQHIRREKATSNICTAQVLLAVIAGFYAVYHGPEGLSRIARRTHARAATLAAGLAQAGETVMTQRFFDAVTVDAGSRAPQVLEAARASGINLRDMGAGRIGIATDETTSPETVEAVWAAFGHALRYGDLAGKTGEALPQALARTGAILTHPVFHLYRSETEMMRYVRRLADKDIALDRAMIPLGSCTMKLNAAAEMLPVTWGGFANVHPFAPLDQAEGYLELIARLEDWLAEITGYDAVSLQPNSGAQGEYAGLLAIRGYHAANGQGHRDVCLIPSSAHGTNPASAQLAGMRVVVVACDENGNVDVADLKSKVDQNRANLAALMVTYPSTHGVFEEQIREICALIHDAGGQVYLDGANLNAQLGLAAPGHYGADVSHLNLHKTFCIPHGGGGPGVGPIGVRAHLAPYLPGHPALADAPERHRRTGPAVSAAPFGSAGILSISYAFIRLMGARGLTDASRVAILSANYIAHRLKDAFPVLYAGRGGFVAHECILDTRIAKEKAGVSVDDIAKRLIDFGFHAPTMSWPVPGTLMIEPTESEPLAELDRFCDAMIAIAGEVAEIEAGSIAHADSPLAHAPHTAETLLAPDWNRAYPRQLGAFPAGKAGVEGKYWPPVARVDNAYGDRNLVCTCPPLSAYEDGLGAAAE